MKQENILLLFQLFALLLLVSVVRLRQGQISPRAGSQQSRPAGLLESAQAPSLDAAREDRAPVKPEYAGKQAR